MLQILRGRVPRNIGATAASHHHVPRRYHGDIACVPIVVQGVWPTRLSLLRRPGQRNTQGEACDTGNGSRLIAFLSEQLQGSHGVEFVAR